MQRMLAEDGAPGHVITSRVEHVAVLETCKALEAQGYAVTYLDVDSHGRVDPAAVVGAVRPSTRLVTLMHANVSSCRVSESGQQLVSPGWFLLMTQE